MYFDMTPRQHVFAVVLALCLLGFVLELVRRRQLREDYAWLWIMASAAVFVLVAWPRALAVFTRMTGANQAITAATVLGMVFLMAVCIHLCIKLTVVNGQVKRMAQEIAILKASSADGEAGTGSLQS